MNTQRDSASDHQAASKEAVDPQVQKKGRMALMAMIGIVALPVLASTFIYFSGIGIPSETVNRGQLVTPPVDLQALVLTDNDGLDWNWRINGPVYKLVQFLDASSTGSQCSKQCRHWLYTARQVHTRLGKDSNQVEQVLVYSGALSQNLRQTLESEYPGVILANAGGSQWQDLLPGDAKATGERLYVVDRRSHLVMYYDERHSGGDLLKDLKHLVKNVQ